MDARAHKFKIGQSVRYSTSTMRRVGSNSAFKIVKLLPSEGGPGQYRIKSASEVHERVAQENELDHDF